MLLVDLILRHHLHAFALPFQLLLEPSLSHLQLPLLLLPPVFDLLPWQLQRQRGFCYRLSFLFLFFYSLRFYSFTTFFVRLPFSFDSFTAFLSCLFLGFQTTLSFSISSIGFCFFLYAFSLNRFWGGWGCFWFLRTGARNIYLS